MQYYGRKNVRKDSTKKLAEFFGQYLNKNIRFRARFWNEFIVLVHQS